MPKTRQKATLLICKKGVNFSNFTELSSKVAIIDVSTTKYSFNYIPVVFQESHFCQVNTTIYSVKSNYNLHTGEFFYKTNKTKLDVHKRLIDTFKELPELTPIEIDDIYSEFVVGLLDILSNLRNEVIKYRKLFSATGRTDMLSASLPEIKLYFEDEDKIIIDAFKDSDDTNLINFANRVPDYDEEYIGNRLLHVFY